MHNSFYVVNTRYIDNHYFNHNYAVRVLHYSHGGQSEAAPFISVYPHNSPYWDTLCIWQFNASGLLHDADGTPRMYVGRKSSRAVVKQLIEKHSEVK